MRAPAPAPAAAPSMQSLRAFVPARDLQESLRFYRHLGFIVDRTFADGSGAIVALGGYGFVLQSFFVKAHAENFMMQVMVDDIDRWWRHLQAARLEETFGVPAPAPPRLEPWGLIVSYVVDPSGVLWHVAAARPPQAG